MHMMTEEQIRERLRKNRELQYSSQARQAHFRGGSENKEKQEKQPKLDVFDEL